MDEDEATKLLKKGGPTLRDLIEGRFETKTVVGYVHRNNYRPGGTRSELDKYSASDESKKSKGNKSFMYVKKDKSTTSKEDLAN
jgi:hypothetical protein